MQFELAVLPGDGVGPDVTTEGVKVLEAVGKRKPIEGVDNIEDLESGTGLVSLQRPDQMPAGSGHPGLLGNRLLDAVFAEIGGTSYHRFIHHFGGKGLADGDQGDGRRITPTFPRRGGDSFLNRRQPFRETGGHRSTARSSVRDSSM